MIDNKKNIQLLVECLKKHSVRNIVISPGGTNIAFVKAVQDDPFFHCFSVVDERSAMYFAIGLYLQTGEVIATSCTSAQATRNYVPGLTEAYYKKVPILAITMSKHPRFTYQEYMQAPDQSSLPNDCVKSSYSLPVISECDDILHSIRLINEAILETTHHGFGPVQLCIPWLDFPLSEITPRNRYVERYTMENPWDVSLKNKKILICIGEHTRFGEREKKSLEKFCECFNCAVYTNHLSNYGGKYSFEGNLLLTTLGIEKFRTEICPDILITIGGQTGDYPFYKLFSKTELSGIEHWRVDCNGQVTDTYDKLTKIFECSETFFFEKLSTSESDAHEYYARINSFINYNLDIELPFSNAYAARKLTKIIPQKSIVQFSILNSLRVWNLFHFENDVECYSNVGAFGIDGGMSTLIGQSMVTNELSFMIIGDLAFFYDMNALGIRGLRNNIRVLLVNNNGGVEFKLGKVDSKDANRYIAAGDHFKNAQGWAETCGFKYLSARTEKEFDGAIGKFVALNDKPIILEIFVSDIDDAAAYNKLVAANTEEAALNQLKDNVKVSVKRLFGKI